MTLRRDKTRERPMIKKTTMAVMFLAALLTAGFGTSSLLAEKSRQPAPPPAGPEQKSVTAVRSAEAVRIDGLLDEAVWQRPGAADFIQLLPAEGSEPTEKTEVWVGYDDNNLYVAALLHDSEPSKILALLGRRDDYLESDWFTVALDPYFDRRTGNAFSVNPAGSIRDFSLSNDAQTDSSWDGVWECQARITDSGWTVEIRIPLNQLRFNPQSEQVWGVNFRRLIKRKNEQISYVLFRQDEIANVSRFARLEGIRDIRPGRNVEVLPYSVGQAQFKPAEPGNPFETGRRVLGNAGLDLKVGLKSNLTLIATINPDFGQVEVDPAVINLSAYESYFQEKRPFFIESAQLFNGFGRGGVMMNMSLNWPNPSLFYSRRIGRAPQGYVTSDGYSSTPDRTTILGAAKVTGRLGGGWNLGLIQALTASEFAQIDDFGIRSRQQVEPLSYYGVVRLQKDFNQGRQGLGFLATGVGRDLDDAFLGSLMNKSAFSLGVDGWSYLDQNRNWVLGGWLGGTRVAGSVEDMLRLQRSSLHYFQRPDADHVEVDPEAVSLSGWGGRLILAKQQGAWLFNLAVGALSPGFNPNDMGFQSGGSDRINAHLFAGRQWTKPGKLFRNLFVFTGPWVNYDFGGNRTGGGNHLYVSGQLLNYWGFGLFLLHTPAALSNSLTRGGPLAGVRESVSINPNLSTDDRKAVVLNAYGGWERTADTGMEWTAGLSLRWKPRSNFSLSWGPLYARSTN
ncbi:MAG: carbohydrate binding family 9 domain-containing protein, partial [Candidatus Aminicenantes bacterium]|nr:carbohydrate binding family 9 domain-containing protein [Candidatus Aminicenantes bacterium]